MKTGIIYLYTDGSCLGNPGHGGWAAILCYKLNEQSPVIEKILTQGYGHTTNNRMELRAVIEGLRAIKNPSLPVILYTDSRYVHTVIQAALRKKKPKANQDLWSLLKGVLSLFSSFRYEWVAAHKGHIYNERCDQLAKKSAQGKVLLKDEGYP